MTNMKLNMTRPQSLLLALLSLLLLSLHTSTHTSAHATTSTSSSTHTVSIALARADKTMTNATALMHLGKAHASASASTSASASASVSASASAQAKMQATVSMLRAKVTAMSKTLRLSKSLKMWLTQPCTEESIALLKESKVPSTVVDEFGKAVDSAYFSMWSTTEPDEEDLKNKRHVKIVADLVLETIGLPATACDRLSEDIAEHIHTSDSFCGDMAKAVKEEFVNAGKEASLFKPTDT